MKPALPNEVLSLQDEDADVILFRKSEITTQSVQSTQQGNCNLKKSTIYVSRPLNRPPSSYTAWIVHQFLTMSNNSFSEQNIPQIRAEIALIQIALVLVFSVSQNSIFAGHLGV